MINPRVDIAFKKIFGVEQNKDLLISLLNSIISEEDQVADVEILNPYNLQDFKNDKLSIVDIKAKNKLTGSYFLIEMQIADELHYHKRGLYGWAKFYGSQLAKSEDYDKLVKTIAIHILNFTFIDYEKHDGWRVYTPNKYHHRFVLSDKDSGVQVFKDIEIHTIELNKFQAINDKELGHIMPKISDMLDRWVAVLTKYDLLNSAQLPREINDPKIKKALEVMQEMDMTRKERDLYEGHLNFVRLEGEVFKKRFLEGMLKGLAEGELKGKAEGLAEGELKGKAEGLAEGKIEIAKKMLAKGQDPESIAEITGLTLDEITSLAKTQ